MGGVSLCSSVSFTDFFPTGGGGLRPLGGSGLPPAVITGAGPFLGGGGFGLDSCFGSVSSVLVGVVSVLVGVVSVVSLGVV